ncbi:MAG: methyltransferase domain-containing protein [Planctomycetota bacterium]
MEPNNTASQAHTAGASGDEREYLLGAHEEELARLGLQHRLWADAAHAIWRRAHLSPGETVLDLGSGPGFASIDLAEWIGPRGRVVAIDENRAFVDRLRAVAEAAGQSNIEVFQGDVGEVSRATGLAERSVDLVWCRWVLCFVGHVQRAVDDLARLVRPGGRVVVQDYFNYDSMTLGPRRPDFTVGIQRISNAFRATGGDPDIMGTLPSMLRAAGFDIVHFAPLQRVARPGTSMWAWPTTFWSSFLPRMVELGHMAPGERDAFLADWDEACQDPDAFMHLPTVYELIAERR